MSLMLTSGTLIDEKFEILELVGRGGIGEVYKARHIEIGRIVAIKLLQLTLVDDESRERFRREGLAMSGMAHKNLPIFYSFGLWQQNIPFIVMEFLSGRTLKSILSDGRLDWQNAIRLSMQICEAMSYVHSCGIVHRDLKPENIFVLDPSEHVNSTNNRSLAKVCDFGLAKIVQADDSESKLKTLTETGFLIGTADYMSPEQCLGRKADSRSDIYSIGCILFHMLSGSPPFTADAPIGVIHKHINDPVPTFDSSTFPSSLNAVIHKALSKEPDERYQDLKAMADDLSSILKGAKPQHANAQPVNKSKRTSWLVTLIVAGSILLCAVALGIYLKNAETSKSHLAKEIEDSWSSSKKKIAEARRQFWQGHGEIAVRILENVLARQRSRSPQENLKTARLHYACAEYILRASLGQDRMHKHIDSALKLLAKNDSLEATELRSTIYAFLARLPGYSQDKTEPYLRLSLEELAKLPKAKTEDRAQLYLFLGDAKKDGGKYEDAVNLYKKALEIEEALSPKIALVDRPALFDYPVEMILTGLTYAYQKEGNDKAIVSLLLPRLSKARASTEDSDSKRHDAYLDLFLAESLANLNRNAEAEKYFDRSLTFFGGEEVLEVERFVFRAADNLHILNKNKKARELVLKHLEQISLTDLQKRLYLEKLVALAQECHKRKDDKAAVFYAQLVIKSTMEDDGPILETCAKSYCLLEEISRQDSKLPREKILRDWLAISRKQGFKSPAQLDPLIMLADYLLPNHKEARRYYAQAFPLAEKLEGPTHIRTSHCLFWQAECSRQLHDLKASEELHKKEITLREQHQADNKPGIAVAYHWLGETYKEEKRPEEAATCFQRSVDLFQEVFKDGKEKAGDSRCYLIALDALIESKKAKNELAEIAQLQATRQKIAEIDKSKIP